MASERRDGLRVSSAGILAVEVLFLCASCIRTVILLEFWRDGAIFFPFFPRCSYKLILRFNIPSDLHPHTASSIDIDTRALLPDIYRTCY